MSDRVRIAVVEVAVATVVDEAPVADEAIRATGTKPMATRCSPQCTVCKTVARCTEYAGRERAA